MLLRNGRQRLNAFETTATAVWLVDTQLAGEGMGTHNSLLPQPPYCTLGDAPAKTDIHILLTSVSILITIINTIEQRNNPVKQETHPRSSGFNMRNECGGKTN